MTFGFDKIFQMHCSSNCESKVLSCSELCAEQSSILDAVAEIAHKSRPLCSTFHFIKTNSVFLCCLSLHVFEFLWLRYSDIHGFAALSIVLRTCQALPRPKPSLHWSAVAIATLSPANSCSAFSDQRFRPFWNASCLWKLS